jgi:hypothetical protein
MKTITEIFPKSVLRALSTPSEQGVARAAGALLKWANSERDEVLSRRSQSLLRGAIRTTKTALPDTDPELIGGIFADILDLWETGQKLDKELRKLTKLRMPRDQEQMRAILLWIEAIQLDLALYWIKEVKKDIPKLLRALDSLERKTVGDKLKRRPVNKRTRTSLQRNKRTTQPSRGKVPSSLSK